MTDNETAPDGLLGYAGDNATDGEPTITEVLAGYAEGGFSSSFLVTDDCQIECAECGAASPANSVSMSSLRRLEGESDPADMIAIVAMTCPACASRGTVALGFGPMATLQDSEVLKNLRDDRGDAKAPANSAPGETTGDDPPPE